MELRISPFFNVADLYAFEGFGEDCSTIEESIEQLPKKPAIDDILDVKQAKSKQEKVYQRFLVKWAGKPTSAKPWIGERWIEKG